MAMRWRCHPRGCSALTDNRFVPIGQAHDELVRVRGARRSLDLLERRVRSTVAMLSRMDIEKRKGSSSTTPTLPQDVSVRSRRSCSSIVMSPFVTS